jgi:hypothetical protein
VNLEPHRTDVPHRETMRPVSGGDCGYDGCDRPAQRGGYCWGHVKQVARGQRVSELVHRPQSSLERLTEAALTYAGAEEDEDFARARDNLRKAAAAYGGKSMGDVIRERLADARTRGVRLGRPPLLEPEQARLMVVAAGGVGKAARVLQVSRFTVFRALRRKGK